MTYHGTSERRAGLLRAIAALLSSLTALLAFAGAIGLLSGGTDFGPIINERLPLRSPVMAGVVLAVVVGVPMTVATWWTLRGPGVSAGSAAVAAGRIPDRA
ncbi:hypothetical protein ACWFOS_14780 [Gordonia terrae]